MSLAIHTERTESVPAHSAQIPLSRVYPLTGENTYHQREVADRPFAISCSRSSPATYVAYRTCGTALRWLARRETLASNTTSPNRCPFSSPARARGSKASLRHPPRPGATNADRPGIIGEAAGRIGGFGRLIQGISSLIRVISSLICLI